MASIVTESLADLSVLNLASAEVREYVAGHGLLGNLREAVALARSVFDVAEAPTFSVEEDPDTGESWIEMKIAARGSVDNVMKAHEAYRERLFSLALASCRQIRLFLHIARD